MPDGPAPIRGRWTIRVCSACGILVEDDRDYGGPLPIDADGCLESPRCGAILPRHEMPEGRDAFGAKACPGEKVVEVVPVPDEAAIERGAKAAAVVSFNQETGAEHYRDVALAVLRAALEPTDP